MTTRAPTNGELTTEDTSLTIELGGIGKRRAGTALYDDFLPQLSGRKALAVYREMGDNDSDIASLLFSVTMIAREIDWSSQPATESPNDIAAADFLQSNVEGLESSWEDLIADALTALQYGWSFQELTYNPDLTWGRFETRPQISFLDWILDEQNRPVGFRQETETGIVNIPIGKGLYFRTTTTKPEGRSALRAAYRSWFNKKQTEDRLMIGVDRNLNGLPVVKLPGSILAAGSGNAQYEAYKKMATRVRVDEQMGVMIPSELWPDTQMPMYDFGLAHPDGNPQFDQVINVIRMWSMNMISTVLAQWQGLGRDAVGSRALAEPLQDLFQTAIGAWLDQLEEQINRTVVKQLFRIQPTAPEVLPRLVHDEVKKVDVAKLSEAVKNSVQAGLELFTGEDGEQMRSQFLDLLGFDRPDALGAVR